MMREPLQVHQLSAWTPFFWSPSAHFLFHENRKLNSYFFIGWKRCDKLLMYLSSFFQKKYKKKTKTKEMLRWLLSCLCINVPRVCVKGESCCSCQQKNVQMVINKRCLS